MEAPEQIVAINGTALRHVQIDEFDRAADRMDRGADVSDAVEELDRELEPDSGPREDWESVERRYDKAEREADAERLLRELKRRMGMDSDEI